MQKTVAAAEVASQEQLLALLRPRDVELSADGRRIAFVVAPAFREKGGSVRGRLWTGQTEGEVAPVEGDGASHATPRFSPDGRRLAYLSDHGHEGRMGLRVTGAAELGAVRGSVEDFLWAPDGSALLVLAADIGADRAGANTATKIVEADADEEDPVVVRPAQHWRRLYLVDANTGSTREVSPDGVNVFELGWAGDRAVAVCTDEPSESAWYDAWLGLLDLETRTAERLYTPRWQMQCPRISPNGAVAWIEGFSSDRGTLTGTVHVLGTGPLARELHATEIDFAGEDALWCAGWRSAGSFFGRLSLDGEFEELGAGDALVGPRFGPRISAAVDGSRIATTYESATEPAEVVVYEPGERRKLTALNADLDLHTPDWRDYRWESFDGLEIEGLLSLPRGHDGGTLPLVVFVHGGPTGSWPWMFAPANGLPLLLAGAGYACFLPNPRGSVGRGPAFAEANLGDMGGGDLRDILAGVDALVREGIADDERVAISGGSYGGFMSSWAVTQTDRFAAAIPFAVVTNWLSFHNTTNIGEFDRLFLQADPYDPTGEYARRSPVYHASRCRTPTLILHGADDLCTPLPQATEFYNALVEAGCETELVVYPREGHGFTEREHQVDFWRRMRDWLDRHLA